MIPQAELNNYKLQVELLQEKLKRSEDDRQQLENKLDHITKKRTECEKATKSQNRQKYQKFLEEQRERNERNKKLVQMLERIDQQAAALSSRSERLKMMKLQYELYFAKLLQSQTPLRAIHANQKIAIPLSSSSSSMLQLNQTTSKSNNFQPIQSNDSQLLNFHIKTNQMEDLPSYQVVNNLPNHIQNQRVTNILTTIGQQQHQQHQQTPIISGENWSVINPTTGMILNNNPNNNNNISNDTFINRNSNVNFDYRNAPVIGYQTNDQTTMQQQPQQHINFGHRPLYPQQIYPMGQVNLNSNFQNSMPKLSSSIDGRTGQLMMNATFEDMGQTNDSFRFDEYNKSITSRGGGSSLMPPSWQNNQNSSLYGNNSGIGFGIGVGVGVGVSDTSNGRFSSKINKSSKDNEYIVDKDRDRNEDEYDDDNDDYDDDDDGDDNDNENGINRNAKIRYKNYHNKNRESILFSSSGKLANTKTNNLKEDEMSESRRQAGDKYINIGDDINVNDNNKRTDVNNKMESEKSQPINIVQRDTKFILKENRQRQVIDENGNNAKRQNAMASETMIGDCDDGSIRENSGVIGIGSIAGRNGSDIADQVRDMSLLSSSKDGSSIVNGCGDGKKLKIPLTISSLNPTTLNKECHQSSYSYDNNIKSIGIESEIRKPPPLLQQLSSVDPVMWNFNGRIDPTLKNSNDTISKSTINENSNSNNNSTNNTNNQQNYQQPLKHHQSSPIQFGQKEKLSIEKIENAIYGELINPKKIIQNELLLDNSTNREDVNDSEFIMTSSSHNSELNLEIPSEVKSADEIIDNKLKTELGYESTKPLINENTTLPKTEVSASNQDESYSYPDPYSQNYENYANYNQEENLISSDINSQQQEASFNENKETKEDPTLNPSYLGIENYSENNSEGYVAPTDNPDPNIDYSTQQYDQNQDYQYPAQQEFTNDQNYTNADYTNYENTEYQTEYDPNSEYSYNYDQQNAAAYQDPNQQYGEGYDQQPYSDQNYEQNYTGEYTGYETQPQQETIEPQTNVNEFNTEIAYQPETEILTPANEMPTENISTVNEEPIAAPPNVSPNVIKPILTTEKQHSELANKKKKRVNFVDSETEESSSAAPAKPTSDDPSASNESDFDFSNN